MAKTIRSLKDLQLAAQMAARDGECVVKLADGTTLTLICGGDTYDDDQDPGLVQALEKGLGQLERGEHFSSDEVLSRLAAHQNGKNG